MVLLGLSTVPCLAQKQRVPLCRQSTFAALKKLPQLNYECPNGLIDTDDKILKLPARLSEVTRIVRELESFNDAAWWRTDVAELNACDLHGQAGQLTAEEKESYTSGDYRIGLFGNHAIRMITVTDPCYQTGYNGSVAFLLYREGDRVSVTKILDGYYSRVDKSLGINFASLNGQQLIEVSTSNSMPPTITNYYYVIDPEKRHAVPKNIFRRGGRLTNEISSAMLLEEPEDLGLPRSARDTLIIRQHHLLPSFSVYAESFADGDARKFKRTVYRWNGRFYAATR
jgi:hypothetical protein